MGASKVAHTPLQFGNGKKFSHKSKQTKTHNFTSQKILFGRSGGWEGRGGDEGSDVSQHGHFAEKQVAVATNLLNIG